MEKEKKNKGIIDWFFGNLIDEKVSIIVDQKEEELKSSLLNDHYSRNWVPIKSGVYNGEKTPGELGSPYDLHPDREVLRLRAYEAELTNDVVGIVSGKFFKWVIGKGLKLQPEPNKKVLKTEKIKGDLNKFKNVVSSRFDIYSNSTLSDYKGQDSLHKLAFDAFRAAFFGDCLIVLRVENGYPNLQVIDGQNVSTPYLDDKNEWEKKAKEKGNHILHGIEKDKRGKHIAYYVKIEDEKELGYKYERVEAYGKNTNRKMAWLITIRKHRIHSDRGIPVISSILEKTVKLDRYTESTVSTAEERAKIVYAIEHDKHSNGENPVASLVKTSTGLGRNAAPETEGYLLAEKTAQEVAATTSKSVFNMPIGSKMSALYSQNEIQFEVFWKSIFNSICAAVDLPPEVALQMYNSNYSASRAAINAWEYCMTIYRNDFAQKFYQPFYELWLYSEILRGTVKAPGYLQNSSNPMVVCSYSKARFTGSKMPHIDPVKEVKAVVDMLNSKLISNSQATELLNVGDWEENYVKLKEEQQEHDIKNQEDQEEPLKKVSNGED